MKSILLLILLIFNNNYLFAAPRSTDLLPGDYDCSLTAEFKDENSVPSEVLVEEFKFIVTSRGRVSGTYKLSADCSTSANSLKTINPGTCQEEKSFKTKLKGVRTYKRTNITRAFVEKKLLKDLAVKLRLRVGGYSDLKSINGFFKYKQKKNRTLCVFNGTIIR